MSGLASLLSRRRVVQRRMGELARELEAIDRALFPRIEAMVAAADGQNLAIDWPSEQEEPKDLPGISDRLRQMRTRLADAEGLTANDRNVLRRAAAEIEERAPRSDAIVTAVTKILTERREPMKTAELHRELTRRGFVVSGKNPINNLSAHLSNRDAFVSTANGWRLRSPELELSGMAFQVSGSQASLHPGRMGAEGPLPTVTYDIDITPGFTNEVGPPGPLTIAGTIVNYYKRKQRPTD